MVRFRSRSKNCWLDTVSDRDASFEILQQRDLLLARQASNSF